ncbi:MULTISPECIES: biosynthetic peptidoglycan transglycosylase [unclassified Mucilaginibacter]|uniref:biosynthetic peptidoglycan transglycosylase n=2 Tax=Mucilaginibacter TaxID=423349 RepID=UPI002AC977A8|nr:MULTISPECIES: biosynthetic peptidoglycan transglycosylase [unclassified Mucilaginibacter]MEB0248656.1 biosynthetic peptidoglycan transglycosylase [Mucilaginibacter sp. 5B2]MEB0278307.1 biosynthetic peptidoglycan transglycosylase [Mucilaginibacter sp. 10B2]MEB0301194.1 biosynthetic peptidoglycan transglycosylase [Mucilaginibacter sp. 5C4]WPX23953.1 biosynthetic peptidoglycan transglycosylase [Mucilaginibacter sp. 5C4]
MKQNPYMRRINPKYIRIAGITVLVLVVIMLIGGYVAYSKREVLLQKAIYKAKAKAKRDYNLDVKIGSAKFTGLSTVAFTDISVVPFQRDSLLNIKNFSVSVKLLPLIFGNIKLADVILQDGFLNLTSIKGVKNFDFLFKKKKDTTNTGNKVDLSVLSNNLINEVLYKIPDNLSLHNFRMSFVDDSTKVKMLAQTAIIKGGKLASTINVNDGDATWHIDGKMVPSDKDIDVHLYADGKKVELPIIQKKFKLKLNFDTISTKLSNVKNSSGETRIYGSWSVRNLLLNHPGLSVSDIVVPYGSIDANVFVGSNYVSLDSSSVIHLKKLTANPYLKYTLNPVKIYEAKVNTGWVNAQDVFDSFPTGMFESLDGIRVTGKLNYSLNMFMNRAHLDDMVFDSRLQKDGDFKILKYGRADLGKLNSTFVYTPYEKGKPMPPHTIGAGAANFTPLENISPNIRNAVMTAEDPSFYTNRGFVDESIRKSIITDIKEKKFKRGGSTISMQLIKNAFLSRNKTLSRKIEEILIVWLIENNRLMSKNRMLEVYFNIIEWGRGIYGISEASHYYFGKSPSELTIGESIYLASIVPNPKAGLYAFQPDGSLRQGLHGYFNLIGRLMAKKGLTQPDTSAYGFYSVRLREGLRQTIAPIDTAVADSLMHQSEDDDAGGVGVAAPVFEEPKKPGLFQRLFGKKDTTEAKMEKRIEETNDAIKARLKLEIEKVKADYKLKVDNVDTAGRTKKEIRAEKNRLKDEGKAKVNELKDRMP